MKEPLRKSNQLSIMASVHKTIYISNLLSYTLILRFQFKLPIFAADMNLE